MTTTATPRPPRGRWQQANVWAGYLIFGFPAVAAVPALIATIARFGLLDSILNAGPAALAACLPLALWIRYTRRRPGHLHRQVHLVRRCRRRASARWPSPRSSSGPARPPWSCSRRSCACSPAPPWLGHRHPHARPPAGTDHQERPVTPTPRTHQLEAIAAIQAHLHTTDRVSVLMACGTGKTLVGRWLAEQRQACATTLVVVPSLALIAQTLSEWRSAAGWLFEALIICSDPSTAAGAQERAASDGEDIPGPFWARHRAQVTTSPAHSCPRPDRPPPRPAPGRLLHLPLRPGRRRGRSIRRHPLRPDDRRRGAQPRRPPPRLTSASSSVHELPTAARVFMTATQVTTTPAPAQPGWDDWSAPLSMNDDQQVRSRSSTDSTSPRRSSAKLLSDYEVLIYETPGESAPDPVAALLSSRPHRPLPRPDLPRPRRQSARLRRRRRRRPPARWAPGPRRSPSPAPTRPSTAPAHWRCSSTPTPPPSSSWPAPAASPKASTSRPSTASSSPTPSPATSGSSSLSAARLRLAPGKKHRQGPHPGLLLRRPRRRHHLVEQLVRRGLADPARPAHPRRPPVRRARQLHPPPSPVAAEKTAPAPSQPGHLRPALRPATCTP
jgi:hypothetical protein